MYQPFGGRRYVPHLEGLGERALPSVTVEAVGGLVTIRGDAQANTIEITDTGTADVGNVTVVADGETYTFDAAVTDVEVIGGSGGDTVTYSLTGDLAVARTVSADLGNGHDTFTANLAGNLLAGADLAIEALGKNGKDTLSFDGTGGVAADAALALAFDGGNGMDAVTVDYAGLLDGSATFSVKGGNGKDELTGTVAADAASTGSLTAEWLGGNGVDTIGLDVTGADALAALDASVNGGMGKDQVTTSDNVDDVEPGKK
jgi:fibronectin-binding autotransporter adhesin